LINSEQLESLVKIVGENLVHSDLDKRNEAINAFYHVFGTLTRKELSRIVEPYIPKLNEILHNETDVQIKKAIVLILNNNNKLPDTFPELLEILKLGIEEYGISGKVGEKLFNFPDTYNELKEAILEMLHSTEKYSRMLATATIKRCSTRPSYVSNEQLIKDWLQILRNLIHDSKIPEVRMIALKSLPDIVPDILAEVESLRKEQAYDVLYNIISQFQPNVQVPLNRIIELASPSIDEQTLFFRKHLSIRMPTWDFTKEMYKDVLKEIVANGAIAGEYFELEQVFARKNGKELISLTSSLIAKKYVCYYCGSSIKRDNKTCDNCKNEILRCNICKQPLSLGEEVVACKHCETKSHFDHLHEWVKIQGKCPTCQKKLTTEDIKLDYEIIKK